MASDTRISIIVARAQRLRLPQKELARRAGLDEDTLCRTFRGRRDPLNSTLIKIEQALDAEELELRDYLVARHPLPETRAAA